MVDVYRIAVIRELFFRIRDDKMYDNNNYNSECTVFMWMEIMHCLLMNSSLWSRNLESPFFIWK